LLARRDPESRRRRACSGGRIDDPDRGRTAATREPAAHERLAHVSEPNQQHSRVPPQRRLLRQRAGIIRALSFARDAWRSADAFAIMRARKTAAADRG
jgi:hypothetical protein